MADPRSRPKPPMSQKPRRFQVTYEVGLTAQNDAEARWQAALLAEELHMRLPGATLVEIKEVKDK